MYRKMNGNGIPGYQKIQMNNIQQNVSERKQWIHTHTHTYTHIQYFIGSDRYIERQLSVHLCVNSLAFTFIERGCWPILISRLCTHIGKWSMSRLCIPVHITWSISCTHTHTHTHTHRGRFVFYLFYKWVYYICIHTIYIYIYIYIYICTHTHTHTLPHAYDLCMQTHTLYTHTHIQTHT